MMDYERLGGIVIALALLFSAWILIINGASLL